MLSASSRRVGRRARLGGALAAPAIRSGNNNGLMSQAVRRSVISSVAVYGIARFVLAIVARWSPAVAGRYLRCLRSLPPLRLALQADGGGAEEARTPDPLLAKEVLSQLSYGPLARVLEVGCRIPSTPCVRPDPPTSDL